MAWALPTTQTGRRSNLSHHSRRPHGPASDFALPSSQTLPTHTGLSGSLEPRYPSTLSGSYASSISPSQSASNITTRTRQSHGSERFARGPPAPDHINGRPIESRTYIGDYQRFQRDSAVPGAGTKLLKASQVEFTLPDGRNVRYREVQYEVRTEGPRDGRSRVSRQSGTSRFAPSQTPAGTMRDFPPLPAPPPSSLMSARLPRGPRAYSSSGRTARASEAEMTVMGPGRGLSRFQSAVSGSRSLPSPGTQVQPPFQSSRQSNHFPRERQSALASRLPRFAEIEPGPMDYVDMRYLPQSQVARSRYFGDAE